MIRPKLKELATARGRVSIAIMLFLTLALVMLGSFTKSQAAAETPIIGERLTYNVSFGQFDNIAYAELYTVSRGKLSNKDVIELRARIKTFDLIGAAFYSMN